MIQTVFNRYEKKYMLNQKQYALLLERIAPVMEEDEYGLSTVCNIYYDTDESWLIRRSLDKPIYKEKLRLRSYGIPGPDSMVFLEIKKKYQKMVNKRRVQLRLNEAYDWLECGIHPEADSQIIREIDFFLRRYSVKRNLYLAYDRIAYRMKNGGEFRMTIDQRIRSRKENMGLEEGDGGVLLLKDGQYLLESKICGATPLWFAHILSDLEIQPVSFSKYGTIYIESIEKILPVQVQDEYYSMYEKRGVITC